jgi:hypothetical protein
MSANPDPTLANRYLADQLPESERREYEALLASSSEAVSELEATARLKVGLERLRDTGELEHLLQRRPRSIPSFVLPLAAAIAAVAIGITLWWSTLHRTVAAPLLFASQSSLIERAGHPLPLGVTVALFTRRAGTSVATAERPISPAAVELRILPTSSDRSHRYRLSLSHLRETAVETLAEVGNLTPAEDGFVEVYADAIRLTPGRYEVIVTDEAAALGTTPDVFMFDWVTRQNR